jgi:hypothetical protein
MSQSPNPNVMAPEPIVPVNTDAQSSVDRAFSLISLAAVLTAVVAGFWMLGSPGKQRLMSFDATRIQDLSSLSSSLGSELVPFGDASKAKAPPAQLPGSLTEQYRDPETNQPYEYRKLTDETYELCATFALSYDENTRNNAYGNEAWKHPAGRHCFVVNAKTSQPKL